MSNLNITFKNKKYSIDKSLLSGSISSLETVLEGLSAGGDADMLPAGLYEAGAIALYEEQGAAAVEGMMVKPWDDLVSSGEIVVDNGSVFIGSVLPDNLPELNEYGFYYGVPYCDSQDYSIRFYEDGSMSEFEDGGSTYPAGSCEYDAKSIYIPDWDLRLSVRSNGAVLADTNGYECRVGSKPEFGGELVLPSDDTVNTIGDYTFSYDDNLTGVLITDSVTHIGEGAFQGASKLASVVIPGSIKSIEAYAFANCEGLSHVTIGEGVESIEHEAFTYSFRVGYDPGSSIVYMPSTILEMHDRCFGHTALTDIYYNGTCAQFRALYESSDGIPFYYNSIVDIHCTDGDYAWT